MSLAYIGNKLNIYCATSFQRQSFSDISVLPGNCSQRCSDFIGYKKLRQNQNEYVISYNPCKFGPR